jgi:hypothetical protein
VYGGRKPDPVRVDLDRFQGSVLGQSGWIGHKALQDKPATWTKMGGNTLETLNLLLLGGKEEEGVVNRENKTEKPFRQHLPEVSLQYLDLVSSWLSPQLFDHGIGNFHSLNRYFQSTEWECDPAGPDPQFKDGTLSGQPGEEMDCK